MAGAGLVDTAAAVDHCPADHRQLFSRLNENGGRPDDSSGTDPDDVSDDGSRHPGHPSRQRQQQQQQQQQQQDDMVGVGVSIGRGQTVMKSVQTPALEKTRLLEDEHGNGYFAAFSGTGPREVVDDDDDDDDDSEPAAAPPRNDDGPLARQAPLPSQRSLPSRTLLGSISISPRQRSSSGSMLTGFKRVLHDLPSLPTLKALPSPFASSKTESAAAGKRDGSTASSPAAAAAAVAAQNPADADGQSGLALVRTASPGSLRSRHRANSDSSLYLSRRPTSILNYDDPTVYAAVSEQVNSRLKAITDALQNSSLRLPRLPSVMASLRANDHHGASANTGYEQPQLTALRNSIRTAIGNGKQPTTQPVPSQPKRAHPILADALSQLEGDVVVLGGYRGSVLRDAKPPHRQLWAPLKVGFNLRSVDLELGLSKEDEERAREKVIPSGVLSHIGPIDICRRLLKHMKKCPNAQEGRLRVHDWGYDWRLSPDLLSRQFIAFLHGLECNQQQSGRPTGAFVIAHSLGGLITRHAVNQRPDLFAGVVYAGVPQHCVNILGPLRNGDDVLLSSRVLTAQVNFTLRTSFALLPESGRCFFQRDTLERFDVDFFDLQTWEEHRLSPCIAPALPANGSPPPQQQQQQLAWWQQHRKSLIDSMGSLSDSMTAALPSLPSVGGVVKRRSWFGGPMATRDDAAAGATTSKDIGITFRSPNYATTPAAGTSKTRRHSHSLSSSPPPAAKQATTSSLLPPPSTSTSAATAVTIPREAARAYLARTLAEVRAFKRGLAHREALQAANAYPPHALVFGKGVPTVYGARVASRAAIARADAYDDLAFAAGDGVVLASAAQLPDGYRCVRGGRVATDRGHVGLLGDLDAVGRCLAALVHARNRGVGKGRAALS